MDRLLWDIRTALRSLRRAPTFAVTAVIILAVGIGMAVAVAAVFRTVLVARLPVQEENRLVLFHLLVKKGVELGVHPDAVEDARRVMRSVRGVAGVAWLAAPDAPGIYGDRTIDFRSYLVTANFFDVLGARPTLGRLLQPEDGAPGAAAVAVLSYRAWVQKFGADPGVVGKHLASPYSRLVFTIVGIGPAGLDFPPGTDDWGPVRPDVIPPLGIIARLAPNVTPASAAAEILPVFQRAAARMTRGRLKVGQVDAETLRDKVVGDIRPILFLLAAAVALLFFIACVNVGNLVLLRAATRGHELAIRRAVGAGFGDMMRHLLIENALIAGAGGVLGMAVAQILLRVLVVAAPAHLPRLELVALGGLPVTLSVVVTLLAVLLFGILPAFTVGRSDLASPLRFDARSGAGSRKRRAISQTLVASQVALAIVTVAGAGLLVRSLDHLLRVQQGYTPEHLSVFTVSMPAAKYDSARKVTALEEQVEPLLRAVPGVVALAPIAAPPFTGANSFIVRLVTNRDAAPDIDALPFTAAQAGGSELFTTLGIRLLRGRPLADADREGAPRVAVVSRSLAERLWPGENPLGKQLMQAFDPAGWVTVVGEVDDSRFRDVREIQPTVYFPWRQMPLWWYGGYAVRTSTPFATVLPAMQRAVRTADPELTIWKARSLDDLLADQLSLPRLSTLVLSSFALVALLLAAIGLYGVMASAVRERTRELGLRVALGATPATLRREVLRRAATVLAVGAVVGLLGALGASRLIAALLFQVSPADPLTLVTACAVLGLVGFVAAYVPALRAGRVDPVTALRAE